MVFYFFICVLSKFKSVLLILTSNITLHYISANVDTFIIHAFIFYYHCPVILLKKNKKGLIPQMDSAQIVIFVFVTKQIDKMGKGTHFFGQPVYCQQKNRLTPKIVEMSRNHGGERYIKSFDGWQYIVRRKCKTLRKVL